jgi:molecular chaperone GrpE
VLDAAKDSSDEQLAKGAAMVHDELLGVLQRAGLEPVPGAGEPFDPNWHEAMMQVEAAEPVEAPVVAEVMRPGYRFKDRVLRPASVSVAQ